MSRVLTVSLAAASLALVGCAKPGLQALPTAPWEVPVETPGPAIPAETSAPEPETEGSVPGVTETPFATKTPAQPAPTQPVATPAPTPQATRAATPRATTRSTSKATTTSAATARPTRPAARPAGATILGRGATGDRVRDLQARLKQLNWFSGEVTGNYGSVTSAAVANFQTRRGLQSTGAVDQATLSAVNAMTRTPTKAELGLDSSAAPGGAPSQATGLDPRCMTGRVLCISKRTNSLKWVIDGQVQRTMAVRFGTKELPTREGTFSVGWKSRDHVSNLYHTQMPYAMFFSGGQAVHYSPDFAKNGYSGGSHGCVNVRDKAGIQALFNQVRVGDKVVVHR